MKSHERGRNGAARQALIGSHKLTFSWQAGNVAFQPTIFCEQLLRELTHEEVTYQIILNLAIGGRPLGQRNQMACP
jgi:hypothetical protein